MLTKVIDQSKIDHFAKWLERADKIVIVAHVAPDGDAVGSSLGLWHFLNTQDKDATVIVPNAFPDFLKWMQNALLRWIEQLPLASIDRIWVDIWDVFLFYCCLLLFCRVWMRRTAANVYIALSALLLCVSYHSYAFITDAPRRSIVSVSYTHLTLPTIA